MCVFILNIMFSRLLEEVINSNTNSKTCYNPVYNVQVYIYTDRDWCLFSDYVSMPLIKLFNVYKSVHLLKRDGAHIDATQICFQLRLVQWQVSYKVYCLYIEHFLTLHEQLLWCDVGRQFKANTCKVSKQYLSSSTKVSLSVHHVFVSGTKLLT